MTDSINECKFANLEIKNLREEKGNEHNSKAMIYYL